MNGKSIIKLVASYYDKIIYKEYIILGLILFPFILTHREFIVVETRYQFFIISASLATILIYFIKKLQSSDISVTLIDFLFLLKLGYEILSRSIFSNNYFFSFETSESILLLLIYIFLRTFSQDNTSFFKKYAIVLSVLYVAEILFGLGQEFNIIRATTSQERLSGSLANNTIYSHFLVINFPIIILFFSLINSRLKYIAIISLTLVICYLVSESRVSLFTLALILALLLYFIKRKNKNTKAELLIIFSFMILFFIILASFDMDSLRGRFLIWSVSGNIFLDFPISGVGYGNFKSIYPLYQANYFKWSKDRYNYSLLAGEIEEPYNEFIRILIEQGILGIIVNIILIFLIMKNLRGNSKLRNYVFLSFISFYIIGLTSYPFSALLLKLNFLFIVVLASNHSSKMLIPRLNVITKFVLLIGYSYICIILNFRNWEEFKSIKSWKKYYTDSNAELNPKLEETLKYNSFFMLDLAEYLFENKKYKECITTLKSAKNITKASHIYILGTQCYMELEDNKNAYIESEFASNLVPNLIYTKYLLIRVLVKQNNEKEALKVINKVLSMPIKIKSSTSTQLIEEVRQIKVFLLNKNTSQ